MEAQDKFYDPSKVSHSDFNLVVDERVFVLADKRQELYKKLTRGEITFVEFLKQGEYISSAKCRMSNGCVRRILQSVVQSRITDFLLAFS